jgi:hypothetical protein
MSTTTLVTPTPPATQSVGLQNLLSALRALGALIGAYLVGHAIFGHTITEDVWQVVGGAALTVVSTVWGIVTKTSNIEGIESSVRSIIAALGGLGVSYGVITGAQLATILAAIIPVATVVQSALAKSKTQQIAAGTVIPLSTGKVVTMTPANQAADKIATK